jgi:PAS domain S-box-containing protein
VQGLRTLGGDLDRALARVNVPAYVIDSSGVVRWINGAARELVGDIEGRQFTSILAPEDRRRARDFFARKVAGTAKVTDGEFCILDLHGDRMLVEVSSVPFERGGHVIGVFGQVAHRTIDAPLPEHPTLTPRQAEVLRLLEHGRSTLQIARELHISTETVRNHVRGVFRALEVHSRLEAVTIARREHLVAN